ncbi:MAG: hypothetical protein U0835_20730 [Isosphaeraceae bacterium]
MPQGHWKVLTLTAAIRLDGVGGCLTFDGRPPTPSRSRRTSSTCWPRRCALGDIVVMDNLSAHRPEVERLIGRRGGLVIAGRR